MTLVAEVAKDVRKGVLFFGGGEFTLQFDQRFVVTHRQEYLMYVEMIKKLRQVTFDDRRNMWNIKQADDAVRCLNQLVSWGIQATKDALAQLGIQLTKLAQAEALAQASTEEIVDLTIPGPNEALNKAMKNYQRGGVKRMIAFECSYNGDEMGLGKSLQLLASVEYMQAYPMLIVCPGSLKHNWLAECRRWLPHRRASLLTNDLADITILAYSEIHKYVNAGLGDPSVKKRKAAELAAAGKRFFFPNVRRINGIACDEGHFIKHADSRRTMSVMAIATACQPRMRAVLSGTPIENGRPAEMIAPLTFLGKMEAMGGWHHYATRYCAMRSFEMRGRRCIDINGASNTREMYEKLKQVCYIRRTKKEVLKELPDKIQSVQDAELSNRSEYNRIEKDITAHMIGLKGRLLTDKEKSAQAMTELSLLRRLAGVGKVPSIVEWIDTFLESGEKFVIYALHREVQHALVEGLQKWNPAVILGGCEDVIGQVNKFKNDKTCRVIVMSITSAGFGINGLQEVCSHIGIAELLWTDSKHQQAIDRLHRLGQKVCVNAYYFLAKGTIDDDMWEIVTDKARITASAVDGQEEEAQTSVLANLVRKYQNPKPETRKHELEN